MNVSALQYVTNAGIRQIKMTVMQHVSNADIRQSGYECYAVCIECRYSAEWV